MKLILLKDLKNYGKKNDVINVSDGYAKNYLIPKKIAMLATKETLKKITREQQQKFQETVSKKNDSIVLKEQLEKIMLAFTLKTNKDQVFGTISSKQIIEKLRSEHAIDLDKKQLVNFQNLNYLGFNEVKIKLYEDVWAVLKIQIKGNN